MKKYKRIILKLSGDFFRGEKMPVDAGKVVALAKEVKAAAGMVELGIIFGAGNIWRGRNNTKKTFDETASHFMGIMGTFVNALALDGALKHMNVTAHILAPFLIPHVAAEIDSFDIDEVFEHREILIFAGGTGRPGVTNDTAAIERARDIGADAVFKATRVDGVYDKDPEKFKKARKFDTITYEEYLKRKLGVMDQEAVRLARDKHIPIVVFKWGKGVLGRQLVGKGKKTVIE